ncbi:MULTISPECIES: hypothetical protein [Legionella]|uniref:Uncharacterized protein n=1 Tax=Legionella drozanskii LLAP-1 TaxID=1212489 RepID=A0A0W0SX47_9GAMM|nr:MULTISPECIES: hypothetical protein [Legionella]KTC87896.1 hypothetical protein Ldro_1515 [Legionella drozanskii LLAP-1]PJE09115.1 MAG: hypothetical protein CK430_11585 [Legionella sp.]
MTYRLKSVRQYASNIVGLARPLDVKVSEKWSYKQHKEQVDLFLDALRKQENQANLIKYALAVEHLAAFLHARNEKCSSTENDAITQYVDVLKVTYKKLNPNGKFYAPNPIGNPVPLGHGFADGTKAVMINAKLKATAPKKGGIRGFLNLDSDDEFLQEEVVGDFLDSPEIGKLKEYLEYLRNDPRDHSFLCCVDLRVNKVKPLEDLIKKLEGQQTKEQLIEVLQEFYAGKNKIIENDQGTWTKSDYEVLNTGQGWFTRLFSPLVRTTTISLIDNFAISLGFDPELTQAMNQELGMQHN